MIAFLNNKTISLLPSNDKLISPKINTLFYLKTATSLECINKFGLNTYLQSIPVNQLKQSLKLSVLQDLLPIGAGVSVPVN